MTNIIKNTNDTDITTVKSKVNERDMETLNCEEPGDGEIHCMISNDMVKELLKLSVPIIISQICQTILLPLTLMFCGHLDDKKGLDGAALALSVYNVIKVINCTVLEPVAGLSTACDSLFSQTIRSKNTTLVGDYIQKVIVTCSIYLVPVLFLFFYLDYILILFGQNPDAAGNAREFVLPFIPGAWSYTIFVILNKYLLSMDIANINVIIMMTSIGLNILLEYIFLYHFHFGTRGSANALSFTYFLSLVLTLVYIWISKCYLETWSGWSMQCFKDLGPVIKLAFSGMLMVAVELWAFEICIILAGILGPTALGAQSMLLQLDTFFYQIPLGIQIACSIKVGQSLGAGDIGSAKNYGWAAMGLTFAASIVPLALFVAIPAYLARIFTSIQDIVDLTAHILPLAACYALFDGFTGVFKGILIGCGRQMTASICMLVLYYVISIPIGVSLMFSTSLKLTGYYIGLLVNAVCQSIVFLVIVTMINWRKEMEKANERNKTDGIKLDETTTLHSASDADYSSITGR